MAVSCRYSLTCCWLMSHDLVSGWDMAPYIEAIDSQFFLLKGSILDLFMHCDVMMMTFKAKKTYKIIIRKYLYYFSWVDSIKPYN